MTGSQAATRHTDRSYEADLAKLRENILLMGAKVEELLTQALSAFVERDSDLARQTLQGDTEVDRLELEIDEQCLRILAKRQPVASDLRFITSTMKLVTDLERIGDLAVNVCERVIELTEESPLSAMTTITRMGAVTTEMLRGALDSFVSGDADAARAVIERDSVVDATYAQLFPELVAVMMDDPKCVYRATRLQSVGKYLERIADHATNVAEMVVFMVEGEDVRHAWGLSRGTDRSGSGLV
ncbi:MAG TPA: phosphate signaling complex protein PhoU [Polyangiaceae bacterium]|nr:phosphate signaling complex protein PhoU [Polyangiaceae bacterium]HMR73527.1 phosphate signaling complex protein PhoU [Polyangiaceae bacterium]